MALPGSAGQCVSLGEGGHVLFVGLWGGSELEESPPCASLEQVVSVMGMGARCTEMSMVGSCSVSDEAWLDTVSLFPLLRMKVDALGVI